MNTQEQPPATDRFSSEYRAIDRLVLKINVSDSSPSFLILGAAMLTESLWIKPD